ncbi:MAG TPA: ABC transporter permease [Acidimicrobiales bacterium]|nr:ABC transporter permease [Acidimicrobiales bacterium]
MTVNERVLAVGKVAAIVLGGAVAIQLGFDPPTGTVFNGLCTGTLYGLIGVSLILVYRTHRIINFAVAGIGAVPGISAVLLMVTKGWSWYVAFPMAIAGGALAGGLVDFVVMRRFSKAPRLILTVATIGVSQILAYIGFLIGLGLGTEGEQQPQPTTPFSKLGFFIGNQKFTHDYTFAVAVVITCVVALGLFLRFSRIGIALRASAENAERASLLGIPVSRVQTVSWVLAGALAGVVLFLLSTIVGVPGDGSLGPQTLIYALTAAVIGRMDRIGVTLVAGMGVGVLVDSSLVRTGSDSITTGVMLAIILGALVLQRGTMSRALDAGVATWQAVGEFRAVPSELRNVREVRIARRVLAGVIAVFFLTAPFVLDDARIGDAHTIVIACIVAVSLVILTGWAGQISLGQFGIVGVGAIVASRMAVTWNQDIFLILLAAAIAGAVVAVLVGLPALRLPGLYLAVTTLAFSASMHYLFLNRSYWIGRSLLPPSGDRIVTPCLWDGRICLGDGIIPTRGYYYFCLAILAGVVAMARAYRSTRAGRAVLAVRENSRAASSYSVHPARTKLAAFAVSGAVASIAGALIAFQSGSVDASTYGVEPSLRIFVTVVIGGLTSLGGAVFGTILLEAVRLFGEDAVENLSLLVTGPGLLVVLLLLPGGFAEGLYRLRDAALRWVANRNDIDVPSLVADRLVEARDQPDVVSAAEHAAAELVEHASAGAPR